MLRRPRVPLISSLVCVQEMFMCMCMRVLVDLLCTSKVVPYDSRIDESTW